ncbi:MAG: hypothetical protein PHC28_08270 [Flavobacterium sp.]|uniref:DUF3108 domain-containing protein n=1 Tax=Flavobacterium sp. TaxID=239 RepID=UPI00260EA765|nr:hypothetical protein [Flavobacterium sp.]MDD5150466.1 hypothetical protein [Flavobacterium sp.]
MNKIKQFLIITLILNFQLCFPQKQTKILPDDKSIDKTFLKSDSFTMGYSIKQNGSYVEIGNYETKITVSDKRFDVKTALIFHNSNIRWEDHFIADVNSFKPISYSSNRSGDRNLTLSFANTITGEFQNNKNGKKTPIKVNSKEDFFDISIYPFILKALPLESGYKATIPVYDYEAVDANKRFCNIVIKEVKTDLYISDLTGEHKVWKVSVFEESTKHNFQYFIDKINRKIWQITIVSNKGDTILLKNKETDFNPFQNKFDKEETLKLVNDGNTTIEGVAFARDNENEGMLKGMAVLNINKKQFAPKGTTIVLMPYTAYFKEWMELNKKQAKIKNAKTIPLPKDAFECFKFTTIYDDNGHFEFTNLLPSDYLLSTSFGYNHTSKRSEVTGMSDVYIGGNYVGSNVYTSVFSYSVAGKANVQKVVNVVKNGDKLQVKLKKTL